ncbi:Protein of unknown function DUF4228, plant protein [Actinidia chinensis var. chinensis]|uniref:Uncharacterized protein n=1 Tax=Actinidia chinensis var. chinensis TaxID=1590841 RepID=A0A2R6RSE9_ACTCC|nr:Protein of unknown function DUF4228, plant protein [Actinidia chinensis var. chinensis]
MRNCVVLCKPKTKTCKILQIVKVDGKILKLTAPITVKELLVNFSGLGVAVSKRASQYLPPTYELKIGKKYYLFPCPNTTGFIINPVQASSTVETEQDGGVKRIKVVITRQQLQELLKKQLSVEDVVSGMERGKNSSSVEAPSTFWRPRLEPIPEGSE